jgi:hypothetical protein
LSFLKTPQIAGLELQDVLGGMESAGMESPSHERFRHDDGLAVRFIQKPNRGDPVCCHRIGLIETQEALSPERIYVALQRGNRRVAKIQ